MDATPHAPPRSHVPSIDLARLRKQALRLADFFFAPDEFARNLGGILDSYVNHTIRARRPASRSANLPNRNIPGVVLRQIEHELSALAAAPENADAALALADRLWDDETLESRLLAASILGRLSPEEGPLVARVTAWTTQVRDSELQSRLLDACLRRMREEAPDMFLNMIIEWLRPERERLWPHAIRAAISSIRDPAFANLPALMAAVEPLVEAAPVQMQVELEELLVALYQASPTETAFMVRQALMNPASPQAPLTFRRMSAMLPEELQDEIRESPRSNS